MPTDFSISPIGALTPASPTHQQYQPPQNATAGTAASAQSSGSAAATETPFYTNPDIHIDPASNLVVMAFRNAVGTVIDQFPTQQQLEAYRQGNATVAGTDG